MNRPTGYAPWDSFDTQEYVSRNYGKSILRLDRSLIASCAKALRTIGVEPASLRRTIDVGAGANLYPALLLAPFVAGQDAGGTLELMDLASPNRSYLEGVLGKPRSNDAKVWTKFGQYLTRLDPTWRSALARVRQLAHVRAGAIDDLPRDTYDAVSSFFVAESVTDDYARCFALARRLVAAARPGGLVMTCHTLGSTGWYAGDARYPAVPLTMSDLCAFYDDVLDDMTLARPPVTHEVREDFHGAAVVIGVRRSAESAR